MDLASIASSTSNSISDAGVSQEVSTAVLKKAISIQSDNASQLISAIPAPPNLPSHVGNNVNTVA
jgi:hypothetical protein